MNAQEAVLVRQRSCAVIRSGDRILLCREDGDDFWTLPGGSVEPGEFSHEALVRELAEELGGEHRATVGALLLVCENLFRWRGRAYQEVVMAYEASFDDASPAMRDGPFRAREPHLTFAWTPLEELRAVDLRPSVLVAAIERGSSGTLLHACLRED